MDLKEMRQLEFGCDVESENIDEVSVHASGSSPMRRIEKIISDTIVSIRPYLNRMVKDVERELEGSFIRTPSSSVLEDMVEGLEKDIRKFVDEVKALKRWSHPHPPHSSSNHSK